MELPPAQVVAMQPGEVDHLVEIFRSACMQGTVQFRASEASKITWKQVHPNLKWVYNFGKLQQIYQLHISQPAYLIVIDQKAVGNKYPKICAVVARKMPLMESWEKVLKVKFSESEKYKLVKNSRYDLIEFPLPEEGMKLSISRLWSPFVALQASAMSKDEIRYWTSSQAIKTSPLSKETYK